jgi:Cyclin, C-terminal domain
MLVFVCAKDELAPSPHSRHHEQQPLPGADSALGYWPHTLRKHTGYTVEQVRPVAAYLVQLMEKANNTQYKAVLTKFKKAELSSVARYRAPVQAFADQLQTQPAR